MLVVLRELLRERRVTHATERLGVTQPAAALSRLRRHFGDELLVRDKGEYTLTALGAQLAEQSEAVCAAAERLFAASTHFDPATSEREFTRLHIKLVRESLTAGYADGIRFIDGMVGTQPARWATSARRVTWAGRSACR